MGKRAAEKTEEEIAAEALAAKKAAKKAKKAAAAAAEAEEEEEDPVAAKKAAKKAKKAAAAAAAEAEAEKEEAEAAAEAAAARAAKKAAKKAKKPAAEEEDEAEEPEPKKKKVEAAAPAPKKAEPAPAADDDEFHDNTYDCCDCSEKWVDTADDQQFRWDKGFAEIPKRCKDCRWAKKIRMEGGDPTAKGKGKGKGNKDLEVFIGGLPFSTTEDVLRKDFEECGTIVNFRMPLNDEGACRGIAFCEYADNDGLEKALKFDNTDYGGRYLSVRKSGDDKGKGKGKDKGKGKGNKEFEVFVGGLPFSTTEEALRKDFGDCGEIVNFRLPLNDEGNPRGIAFIEYKDKDACDKALKFHETDYGGRSLSVKMSGDGGDKGKGKGKDKGKKGKKGKAPSESFAKNTGCIVAGGGDKKTFDSDSE